MSEKTSTRLVFTDKEYKLLLTSLRSREYAIKRELKDLQLDDYIDLRAAANNTLDQIKEDLSHLIGRLTEIYDELTEIEALRLKLSPN